jgi:RNA-directed DNA polymerase
LGVGCSDGKAGKRRDLSGVCESGRSQSLHSTEAAAFERTGRERAGQHKPVRGRGGRKGDALLDEPKQQNAGSADEATQGGEAARDFSWAEASVWTKRMLLALGNGVKGGKWYALMDKVVALETLKAAWTKVEANKGAAGVDGQSIERFAAKADEYLVELSTALREGSYRPQAVKRVEIPKGEGKTRPLGIPTVKDRIVQQAVRLVIEPIFEAGFRDGSYGFRPGRGCHDALREVDGLIKEGYTFVVDADLAGYFDSIPHDRLMARVEAKVSDGPTLDLIRGWLKADILKGLEQWTPTRGSPQGAVISPLLANIYLDPLDAAMAERGYRMIRYADDFVILCRTREAAEAALEDVRAWVNANGLALHPEKTHVGDCRQSGQGFEFLGYRFEAGKRYVRKKSLNKLKDAIRAKTKRTRGDSLACIVKDLNRTLIGWFGYFKHAHHAIFERLDGFLRRRLRALLRRQEKRSSRLGMSQADHRRWPNAFFAEAGLFAFHTAWLSARQSR